ncbi:hypothetical protein AW736_07730 [Termitidicoccus mucosus]|uniref:Transposase IS701-like DDE domain-containing protein n=1 Tax=Termitidicoccus mucosus TaxID=1184151 RepID=A0A178IN14_9BACT|nr:hypothetical protein AW736_07730 [Opitutaceae bacterium TSB47]
MDGDDGAALAAQLYLPAEWTDDGASGGPSAARRFQEKWRIALALLDEMKLQLPAYQAIVFNAAMAWCSPYSPNWSGGMSPT